MYTKEQVIVILKDKAKLNSFMKKRAISFLYAQGKTCHWYKAALVTDIDIGEDETCIELDEDAGKYSETAYATIPNDRLFSSDEDWIEYRDSLKRLHYKSVKNKKQAQLLTNKYRLQRQLDDINQQLGYETN